MMPSPGHIGYCRGGGGPTDLLIRVDEIPVGNVSVFLGELGRGRDCILPLHVLGGLPARAHAPKHSAGAAAGFGKLHLANPRFLNLP